MSIVTPGVRPASELVGEPRPAWLDHWGRFAAGASFEALPDEAAARAKLVLLDCIGAIAAGMQEPELLALMARLAPANGGAAPAIGAGRSFAPGAAAFVNGTAGTMLELDEGNQYARGHPGIHVVPAALARAQALGASGPALLLAIALGYEIGARIGAASKLRVTMHPHGTWGVVGAAVSGARLGGADAEGMVQAINVASSLGLATSRRTMLEGGTVRNAYAGFANQLGLMAVDLAAAGFTGETDGVATVYDTVIADHFQPAEMVAELGQRWEIARNYFKRHAACRYTHGALDALAEILRQAGPLKPQAVQAIAVDSYVWAAQLDSPAPANMLAAKFSLPFALATTIVHGAATVPAFRQGAVDDKTIRDLAARVTVREDPALTAQLPGARPARVRLTLADGRAFEAAVVTNRGDTEDPYTADEVRAKFAELAGMVWPSGHVARIIEAIEGLDRALDVSELIGFLSVAPR